LPIALAFMLLACVDLDLRGARVRAAFAALMAVLLALRLGEVQLAWDRLAPGLAAFHRSVLAVERGSRILVTHGDREAYQDESETLSDFGLMHAATLAAVERSALVSTMFTVSGKHILKVRSRYRGSVETEDRIPPRADWLADATERAKTFGAAFWSRWPRDFDYVYVLFARRRDPNPDAARLAPVAQGEGFRLYRVVRRP
jgi:hypothetical protein